MFILIFCVEEWPFLKPCNDCPFLKRSPLNGSPEWLTEILELGLKNPFFEHSCHKTDPKADGYKKGGKKKECSGYIQMLMNQCDGTPGLHGVYENTITIAQAYLKKWL